MPNHYHLLVSERTENGLTLFVRKLNIGFANYFNKKYKRNGSLFQGRSKKILIERDAHFMHILHYIHLNPLDLTPQTKGWRREKIKDETLAREQLDKYRWSSFRDYREIQNFPAVLTTEVFQEHSGDIEEETWAYIRGMHADGLGALTLEN
jgi:putative transposase